MCVLPMMAGSAFGQNLLADPGFEPAGNMTKWVGVGGTTTLNTDIAFVHAGTQSIKTTATTNNTSLRGIRQDAATGGWAVPANKIFRYKAWVLQPNAAAVNVNFQFTHNYNGVAAAIAPKILLNTNTWQQVVSQWLNAPTITAAASVTYQFQGVTAAGAPIGYMDDMELELADGVLVTASAATGGTISDAGTYAVVPGSNKTFTITASFGYSIQDVTVDSGSGPVSVGAVSSVPLTNITAPTTVAVTFLGASTRTISGTVSGGAAGGGAKVSFKPSEFADPYLYLGSPLTATTAADGSYSIVVPEYATYYVRATQTGYNPDYKSPFAVTADQSGVDFTLTVRATNLLAELNPKDFDKATNRWNFTTGTLAPEYFAAAGTPKYVRSAMGLGYSAIQQNVVAGDSNPGFGGPLVPASILGDNPRTLEAWTYNPACSGVESLIELAHYNDGVAPIMYDGGNFSLSNGTAQAICGYRDNTTTGLSSHSWTATTAARSGKWVHLVVTYDRTTARTYLDGVLDSSKTYAYNTQGGNPITIGSLRTWDVGAHSTGELYSGNYGGYIGQIRIYDNALTDAEIAARYALGVNGGEAVASSYAISGTVTDSTTGLPLAGAQVYVSRSSPAWVVGMDQLLTTDALGKYSVSVAEGSTYYVSAMKSRYAPNPAPEVTLANLSAPAVVDFQFVADATLTTLVNLDAATLPLGTNLASWPNTGTLGGSFNKNNATGPEVVANLGGRQAVVFANASSDAANRRTMVLRDALNALVPTPAGIANNSEWTISTDLYRSSSELPGNGAENTYMCWAGRDWSTPQCANFRYSIPGDGGAYSHGNLDPTMRVSFAAPPSSNAWHKVTITYDGNAEKIYVDGVLDRSDTNALTIRAAGLMMLGGANWKDNLGEDQYWGYNGAIGSLTIFDQALTAEEVAISADARKITASAGPNGTISPSGTVWVVNATNKTFTISADSGFLVDKVLVDGVNDPAAVAAASYTFSGVTGDHTIAASFRASSLDPFASWIATYFPTPGDPNAAKDADPDGDGEPNLTEYALNSDPSSGVASGKVRSRLTTVGADKVLVLTLPVLDGAVFGGSPAQTATAGGVVYTIEGSNGLGVFDQGISEIAAETDMPNPLDAGWSYRTFRLDGAVDARGPRGFIRAGITAAP
jgi:hypothetical protein